MLHLPQLAIVLVHRGDRLDFLQYLSLLNDNILSSGRQSFITLYVVNAPQAINQKILSTDIQRLAAVIELIDGNAANEIALVQLGIRSVPAEYPWILLIRNVLPPVPVFSKLITWLHHHHTGLWAGVFSKGSSFHHHPWLNIDWVDDRFLLIAHPDLLQVGGIEEQYFHGHMAWIDLAANCRRHHIVVGRLPFQVGMFLSLPHQYILAASVRQYYSVRNVCMYAAFHISGIRQIQLLVRVIWTAVRHRQITVPAFQQGFKDGLGLLLHQKTKR